MALRTSRIVVEVTHESHPKRVEELTRFTAIATAAYLGGEVVKVELVAHTGKCKRPECGCIQRDAKHETID